MEYFGCKHCHRTFNGDEVFQIVISYNPSVNTEPKEVRYMCFECMKKISNFLDSEKEKHGWFYEELKEIPKEVFENIPVKTENDFCVGIPKEIEEK